MNTFVFGVYIAQRTVTDGDGQVEAIFLDASFEPLPPDRFPSLTGMVHAFPGADSPSVYIGTPAGWRLNRDRGEKVLLHPERPEMRVDSRDAIAMASAGIEGFSLVDCHGSPLFGEPSFTLAG